MTAPTKVKLELGARADSVDFRDVHFQQTLIELPETLPPEKFLALHCPVLDQGLQMACTGFALATVANALLHSRARAAGAVPAETSPEMMYAMARRYDEYPGTNHNGSSIRGAVKGWHRHGVCCKQVWDNEEIGGVRYGTLGVLTRARAEDAASRPLGAYFRVPVQDLPVVHSALAEVGVMIAVIKTHDGWFDLMPDDVPGAEPNALLATLREMAAALPQPSAVGPEGARLRGVDPAAGLIPPNAPDTLALGMHAVTLIGYDRDGIWLQNSLGPRWGRCGIARLAWDDWLDNAQDAWVLRLGAPVRMTHSHGNARVGANRNASHDYAEMRPHIIPIGVDGRLQEYGSFATTSRDVGSILRDELRMQTETWKRRRLLFIASSGLYPVDGTVRTISALRPVFMAQEVYPILLLWNSGFGDRINEILRRGWQSRQPPAGAQPNAEESDMRQDMSLEALCRRMGGWVEWNHVKRMAESTVQPKGAMTELLSQFGRALSSSDSDKWPFEVHMSGESSAAWLLGHLISRITQPKSEGGLGRTVASATLCAPTVTMDFFQHKFMPPLRAGALGRLSLVTLDAQAEAHDGFGGLYHGSLLQLISNALEDRLRIPPKTSGTEMAGITAHIQHDAEWARLVAEWSGKPQPRAEHIVLSRGDFDASRGSLHGRLLSGTNRMHNLLDRVLNADVSVKIEDGGKVGGLDEPLLEPAPVELNA
ncbi:MAG: hypothetical protein EXR79_15160 [Myxococcales bacterium]|nr:hypothetical protein [Myxococcales bacterium]